MCGRFDIHSALEIIAKLFGIGTVDFILRPNYNVAPTQDIPIVLNNGRENVLVAGRWGFLPGWAKEAKTAYSMINARAETLETSRSYRDAFLGRRCLVAADGFYEWLTQGRQKIPHYVRLKSKTPMGFAGLYSEWKSPGGEAIATAAIVTTAANDLIAPLHDRMPVILLQKDFARWLDPAEHRPDALRPLLAPFPPGELEAYRVASKVNSVKYNEPDCIEPA